MSVIVQLQTVSDATIERVLADPPLVWLVIAPDEREFYEEAREAARKPGWLARLLRRSVPPVPVPMPDLELVEPEGHEIDLDKAWHGIHYLLTGSAWGGDDPLDFLVDGGASVGKVDVGYGPARAFTSAQAREIRDAVAAVSDDELRSRFDPQAMMSEKIYPEIWTRDPADDDTLSYVMESLAWLRSFLDQAVDNRCGFMIWSS